MMPVFRSASVFESASSGVKKVASAAELLTGYKGLVAVLSSLAVSFDALFYDSVSPYVAVDAFKVVDLAVLCEQYLDGCEVDVGVVMSEGMWRCTDNDPALEPYFNETLGGGAVVAAEVGDDLIVDIDF